MDLLYKLVQNLLIYFVFVIAIGENSFKMQNNAIMLSSVYDAMKNNLDDNYRNKLYRNDILSYDLRSKRNINEKWDVGNVNYDEPNRADGWNNDVPPSGNELICSIYRADSNTQRILFSNPIDHNGGHFNVGNFLTKALKVVLMGIALFSIPLLLMAALLIPLKIILGIKTMAMANSFVFGTLIWRLINRMINNNNQNNNTTETTPTDQNIQIQDEYHNYNEDDVQRILKSIKHKNKDW